MEQQAHLDPAGLSDLASRSCSQQNRRSLGGHLPSALRQRLRLSEPVAANYLTVEHDPFVDSILEYCQDQQQQQQQQQQQGIST